MGELNFNKRQCVRALKKLGFCLNNDRRGTHDKYTFPNGYTIPEGFRPFIMIPRHNELKLQYKIVKEIKSIGGDDLVEKFMNLL